MFQPSQSVSQNQFAFKSNQAIAQVVQPTGGNGNTNYSSLDSSSKSYFTCPSTVEDLSWYMDSGASDHVISKVDQLALKEDYVGSQQLQVGSGECLEISHTGSVSLPTSFYNKFLHLKNILCVPKITKNLLSISKFTRDNDVVVEFLSDCCFVKDKATRIVLLKGALKDGLYQLQLTSDHVFNQYSIKSSLSS